MSGIEDEANETVEAGAPDGPTVFVNYRHEDTSWPARALYEALATRFGAERVFIDTESINAGQDWLRMIEQRNAGSAVFLALIGPNWLRILGERSKLTGSRDIVRAEIEDALRQGSGALVIPVLIDDARMPSAETLPTASIRGLAKKHAASLREKSWKDDLKRLLDEIAETPRAEPEPEPTPETALQPPQVPLPERSRPSPRTASSPDPQHYDEVASCLTDPFRVSPVVIFLGSGVNASDRGDERWQGRDSGWLPDADELAEYLARTYGFGSDPVDLAQASQYVYLTAGQRRLYHTVGSILTANCPPTTVHDFLAGLPRRIAGLGYPERFQLIVTSNYDDALERAFDAINQPYDLAVYMASDERKGRFVHVPYKEVPRVVDDPSAYKGFPLGAGDDIPVTQPLIVKIHGAIDSLTNSWQDNYVMTEDQYIEYLVGTEVPIPSEITGQIKASHCLFLGYTMRDWNLRIFFQRLWGGQRLEAVSWAIERQPDGMEGRFWTSLGNISLFASPLDEYIRALDESLELHRASAGES